MGHQVPATQDDEFARIHPHNSYKYHKRRIPPGSSERGAEERSTRTENLVTTRLVQRALTGETLQETARKGVQECKGPQDPPVKDGLSTSSRTQSVHRLA